MGQGCLLQTTNYRIHSFNQGFISGTYLLYTSKGFGQKCFDYKSWDSFSLAALYQVQFDELSCLSVPPARELRDLHKDLWLRWVVPPMCRSDFVLQVWQGGVIDNQTSGISPRKTQTTAGVRGMAKTLFEAGI